MEVRSVMYDVGLWVTSLRMLQTTRAGLYLLQNHRYF